MPNLYQKQADSTEYDKLFADLNIDREVKSVNLKSGQGILKRGTVLGTITATGKSLKVNSTAVDGSQVSDSILTDDVDTTAADVVATAYSAGSFNRQALVFGGTDTAANHEVRLRELGIFLKDNIVY
jgi:hypothetical protein